MSTLKNQVNELMENQKHMLEAIKYLDERVVDIIMKANKDKVHEVQDILKSQTMIDEIIVKNSDDILILKKAKDENSHAIRYLGAKIDTLDKEIEKTMETVNDKKVKHQKKVKKVKQEESVNSIECKMCEQTFKRFVDLEIHIKNDHDKQNLFECDQCGKGFVLKWRLRKHTNLHNQTNAQPCRYFNTNVKCPFEEFGCKFLHISYKNCQLGQKCKRTLCTYRHSETKSNSIDDKEIDNLENSEGTEDETAEDTISFTTSTPQKGRFECEECKNQSQCTDCYVKQVTVKSHRVHFSDDI